MTWCFWCCDLDLVFWVQWVTFTWCFGYSEWPLPGVLGAVNDFYLVFWVSWVTLTCVLGAVSDLDLVFWMQWVTLTLCFGYSEWPWPGVLVQWVTLTRCFGCSEWPWPGVLGAVSDLYQVFWVQWVTFTWYFEWYDLDQMFWVLWPWPGVFGEYADHVNVEFCTNTAYLKENLLWWVLVWELPVPISLLFLSLSPPPPPHPTQLARNVAI